MSQREPFKNILDLSKQAGNRIQISFQGGRVVSGILVGHDQLTNLVIDEAVEVISPAMGSLGLGSKRKLGLVVCRGTTITSIFPEDGFEQIENPFI